MNFCNLCLCVAAFALLTDGLSAWVAPEFPFGGAPGTADTTAVAIADPDLVAWASRVISIEYGDNVAEEWRQPDKAVGPPAANNSSVEVVSLGEGGEIVLAFEPAIFNGPGWDFAVFENSFSDRFLELAFVEVSSDGQNFVRFPAYSTTADPVQAFAEIDPRAVYNFAGKYRFGYGTPFDLQQLEDAYEARGLPESRFSETYRSHLEQNFPLVDISRITHVRLVDVAGDGRELDAEGFAIYDPYPTVISAGFDLNVIGVRHSLSFHAWCAEWRIPPVPDADPNGDGWSLAFDYYLDADPHRITDRQPIQLAAIDGKIVGSLRTAAWVHQPEFQFGSNLTDWQTLSLGVAVQVDSQTVRHFEFTSEEMASSLMIRWIVPVISSGHP